MDQSLPQIFNENNEKKIEEFYRYWFWRNTILTTIWDWDQDQSELYITFEPVRSLEKLSPDDKFLKLSIENFISAIESGLSSSKIIKIINQFDDYLYRKFNVKSRDIGQAERKQIYELPSPSFKIALYESAGILAVKFNEESKERLVVFGNHLPHTKIASPNK